MLVSTGTASAKKNVADADEAVLLEALAEAGDALTAALVAHDLGGVTSATRAAEALVGSLDQVDADPAARRVDRAAFTGLAARIAASARRNAVLLEAAWATDAEILRLLATAAMEQDAGSSTYATPVPRHRARRLARPLGVGRASAMANGWMGLNTALSGLRTSQEMLDIASHNIANASTPGYSRQRATLVAAPPFSLPAFNRTGLPGQLGTGVQITSINRIRDVYLDQQINQQQSLTGYWSARSDVMATAESVFPEPSNTGLGNELSKFWSSWEDLAANPSSSAARTAVLTQASSLAARFNRDSRPAHHPDRGR